MLLHTPHRYKKGIVEPCYANRCVEHNINRSATASPIDIVRWSLTYNQ